MSTTSRSSSSYRSPDATGSTEVAVGAAVPPLSRSVSRVQLSLYCAAIRFVHQVHFDDELCRAQGWNGIILPGFLMGNWCLEAVSRMLGPRSVVDSISFKMASVAYPNTTLRVAGEVTEARVDDGLLHTTCSMIVTDEDGTVVTKATVTATVPVS